MVCVECVDVFRSILVFLVLSTKMQYLKWSQVWTPSGILLIIGSWLPGGDKSWHTCHTQLWGSCVQWQWGTESRAVCCGARVLCWPLVLHVGALGCNLALRTGGQRGWCVHPCSSRIVGGCSVFLLHWTVPLGQGRNQVRCVVVVFCCPAGACWRKWTQLSSALQSTEHNVIFL